MNRSPFPIWATIVPVAAALLLWLLTGSAIVLAFAALGPVAAVASRLDQRRVERSRTRAETQQERRQQAADELHAAIAEADEVAQSWEQLVSIESILTDQAPHAMSQPRQLLLGRDGTSPVSTRSHQRIGVVGPSILSAGLARTLAVQQAHAGGGTVVQAERLADLSACDSVIEISSARVARLRGPAGPGQPFAPHYLSAHTASNWLLRHAPLTTVPSALELGPGAGGLPLSVDLFSGPHAIVAGATGSGKTELLRRWMLEMAKRFRPDELSIICIDFKGGTGASELAHLPHLCALLTDLDTIEMDRVLLAIRSELTRREQVFVECRVRSFEELPTGRLGRLVIIVDEYQLLVERAATTTETMADVVARGRALGVHVILATQHPSRVIRDHIWANCGVRLALRLNDPAESRSLVGDDAATRLAVGQVACWDANGVREGRVRPVTAAEIHEWVDESQSHNEPPWLTVPSAHELTRGVGECAVALRDVVSERRFEAVEWQPRLRLAVQGFAGSGRTTVLRRIAELSEHVTWVSDADPAGAFAALCIAAPPARTTIIIDNLDDLLFGLDPEYRQAMLERLRFLSKSACALVVSARGQHALSELFPHLLRLEGNGRGFIDSDPAILVPSTWQPPESSPVRLWRPRAGSAVVCAYPARMTNIALPPSLRWSTDLADESAVRVGSVDQWMMHMGQLESAVDVLFVDGASADLRTLVRWRGLPPLIAPGEAWWFHDGVPVRVGVARTGAADPD